MIIKRILIACFLVLSAASLWVEAAVSQERLVVISPKRLQTLQLFPVPVVIKFGQGIKPETFRASLNDVDVTRLFEKTGNLVQALVGLEHGLRVKTKEALLQTPNMLKIWVQALDPEEGLEVETYFFLNVDQLVTVGPRGGKIQSLDGRLVLDIPEKAVSSRTIAAVAEVRVSGSIGSAYQLSPQGLRFDVPVRVTMKYTPEELPAHVTEDDLFLLLDNGFPRILDQTGTDKASRTISGTAFSTAKFFMSYSIVMGKKPADVPPAEDFRFPIGDVSKARYTCGHEYEPPSGDDLGDALNLVKRSSFADSNYPRIVFNEGATDNIWEVGKAFGWNRSAEPESGMGHFGDAVGREEDEVWNNGEDWLFTGSAPIHEILPVHAIADGLVIYNGSGYGNTVVLAHNLPGGLIFSIYSLLKERLPCSVGTAVHRGNVIGQIRGSESRRPYLHFGIGKADLIKVDAESGEFRVPAVWFEEWRKNRFFLES